MTEKSKTKKRRWPKMKRGMRREEGRKSGSCAWKIKTNWEEWHSDRDYELEPLGELGKQGAADKKN